jgi:hypothetical protein
VSSASRDHIGLKANRLSGHGLSNRAWSFRASLSAKRMDNPSMVRNCVWMDACNAVVTVSLLTVRR